MGPEGNEVGLRRESVGSEGCDVGPGHSALAFSAFFCSTRSEPMKYDVCYPGVYNF